MLKALAVSLFAVVIGGSAPMQKMSVPVAPELTHNDYAYDGTQYANLIIVPEEHMATLYEPILENDSPYADLMDVEFTKKERECMALNVYHESRNEKTPEAIDGPFFVTMNRVMSKKWKNDVCGVVWQRNKHYKTGRLTAHFSWTLDGKSDQPKEKAAWITIQKRVDFLFSILPYLEDPTKGATLYHADYVKPKWNFGKLVQTASLGRHQYYQYK